MIQGLRTAIYPVADLASGTDWYRRVLGQDPYFEEIYYVGFEVGGFELGLIPDGEPGLHGVQVYWGVPDARAEVERLLTLGASVHEAARDVGGGVVVGSILDPFGNVFGVIENPGFDLAKVR